jgi:hypothetical protein
MEKRPVGKGDDAVRAPLAPPPEAAALPPEPPVEAEAAAMGGGGASRRSSSCRTGRKDGAAPCCVNSSVGPGSCLSTSAQALLPHPGLCASWRRRTERGA